MSRGPWPEQQRAEAIEILFEDGSDSPYVIQIGTEQIDRLPADELRDDLTLTVWTCKQDRPHKALELPCYFRRVERIPWMKPWK